MDAEYKPWYEGGFAWQSASLDSGTVVIKV